MGVGGGDSSEGRVKRTRVLNLIKFPMKSKSNNTDRVAERSTPREFLHSRPSLTLPYDKNTSFKILVVSWNMMGKLPSDKTLSCLLPADRLKTDLLVIGTQECEKTLLMSFFYSSKDSWERMLLEYLKPRGFLMVDSQKSQGLHVIAFVKSNKSHHIRTKNSKVVKTGLYGFTGNKGAVSLNLNVNGESLQFINTHLPSNHNQCGNRNDHLSNIIDQLVGKDKNQSIFFFGDMNYRLNVSGQQSLKICSFISDKELRYEEYACKDQLLQQESLEYFFKIFQEGIINFPPTYKLKCEDNTYEKNRITGWTDRIFFHCGESSMVRLDDYYADMFVMGSDHRPVFGSFRLRISDTPAQKQPEPELKRPPSRCLFL